MYTMVEFSLAVSSSGLVESCHLLADSSRRLLLCFALIHAISEAGLFYFYRGRRDAVLETCVPPPRICQSLHSFIMLD
jgi:cytochrome c biogenesis factor